MTRRSDAVRLPGSTATKSFTLIEILVSIAILSILTVVLLSMLGSLMTVWQGGQAHNERRTAAQAILERMSRDLSEAAFPASRYATNSLQMVINPTGVSATYQYPHAIFCQSPVATDGGTNGNLAEVGYFVQWIAGSGGPAGTPCLSRVLINPSSSDYQVYSSPNTWISDTLLSTYAPSKFISVTANNNYGGLMAENVLGLWVQALDPAGNPIQQTSLPAGERFDSRYIYTFTNAPMFGPSLAVLETNLSPGPASLQIIVAVMDSRTARQLTAIPGNYATTYPATSGSLWKDVQNFYTNLPTVIQKGTEIQTTTVTLANGPR